MGYLLIAFLSLVGFATHFAEPQTVKQVTLEPGYVCTGVLDGKSYGLALTLEPFTDGFKLSWVAEGQKLFNGFGIRHGDFLSVLSFDPKGNLSLIAYKIEPGTLNGRWMAGDGIAQTELCLAGKPA